MVVALISDRVIEPRLGPYTGEGHEEDAGGGVTQEEARGLKYATWGLLGILVFFLLLWLPPGAPLRNPETGSLIADSPFMNGLIVFIALVFLVAGAAYGIGAGTMKSSVDVIKAMEKAVAGLGGLIFLLFVISQFNAFFAYTNMATLAAVKMGDTLEAAGLGALAVAPRVRLRRRRPRSDHDGRHPEVGHLRPDLRAAADAAGRRSRSRAGGLPRGRFAHQFRLAHERVFRPDRRVCHEIPEGRRRGHGHRA